MGDTPLDFEIIDGYYFNEGRNHKDNIVMKHLYDFRNKRFLGPSRAPKGTNTEVTSAKGPFWRELGLFPPWRGLIQSTMARIASLVDLTMC